MVVRSGANGSVAVIWDACLGVICDAYLDAIWDACLAIMGDAYLDVIWDAYFGAIWDGIRIHVCRFGIPFCAISVSFGITLRADYRRSWDV